MDPQIIQIANEELTRAGAPLPIELIESLIWVESRGKIGATNPHSGASGLMQVMPGTLTWYQKSAKDPSITLEHLRGAGIDNARRQIRVGIWCIKQFWKSAYDYLKPRLGIVPVDELAKIADLFYVAGPGATRKKLDKINPPTFAQIEKTFPEWNALPHPKNVFSYNAETGWNENAWDLMGIDKWLRGSPFITTIKNPISGFLVAGILLALASHFLAIKEQPNG